MKTKTNTLNERPRTKAICRGAPLWTSAALLSGSALLVAACSAEVPSEDRIGQSDQDIIGGFNATSAVLDHTGALVVDDFGNFEPYCSASLIGDDTVITAKHCGEISFWGYDTYFAIGADSYAPKELIRIAAVDLAPLDSGGFVGYGQDVAVVHLDHAPETDVTPLVPSPSSDLVEGKAMISLGYGRFSAGGSFDGQRRSGRETVIATSGLALEALFGDFESFVEWAVTGATSDEDYLELLEGDPVLDELLGYFESIELLPEHEVAAGNGPHDTQSCNGDSGGPLVRYEAGVGFRTYGVVSGGFSSNRSWCDYGTVFATFGPEVMDFIETAQEWEDPCGEVTVAGACSDNIAQNCVTDVLYGIRELTEQDCGEIGETCELSSGGAACGTPPDAEADPTSRGVGEVARQSVANSYFFDSSKR